MIFPRGKEIIQPELWRDITELQVPNIAPYYKISTYGRVYNAKTNTYLPQNIFYRKDKYITISVALLNNIHIYQQIHRLELMVFNPIESSDLYDVNHIDGVKYHNWIWNLEWVSHKKNMQHAWDNSLFKFGKERKNTKYDEDLVRVICDLISKGKSPSQINDILGMDVTKLSNNIKNGHCWSHISKDYDFSNAYRKNTNLNTLK